MFKKSSAIMLFCIALMACKNDPKTEAAQLAPIANAPKVAQPLPDGSAIFSLTEGTVHWTSAYTLGNREHLGTIRVEGGELWVNEGQILSGKMTIDMNSIKVSDMKDPRSRVDLESHLKDSDFFEVNNFPKAEFIFTEVSPVTLPNFNWALIGDLTMKGNTAPVKIPFKFNLEGDILHAESAPFPINRTTWGVNFRSGLLAPSKDQMIEDTVWLSLKLAAKKK